LENPLPDAHQLFENDPANPRPLCLTDALIDEVLASLSDRMTAEGREQLSPTRSNRPVPLILPNDQRTLDLPTTTTNSTTDHRDPNIGAVYPMPSLKRELTPDLFPQPPSPSSLDQLPSNKRPKLFAQVEYEQAGWLPNIVGINLPKAFSLLIDLLQIMLNHPRKNPLLSLSLFFFFF
jgi:hypothetical protein